MATAELKSSAIEAGHGADSPTSHLETWEKSEPFQQPYAQKDRDAADMRRMGKEQSFKRNFKTVSITSFSLAAMMGFVFIPINFHFVIAAAGTGGTIVIFIATFFGFLPMVLSMAEMSSIAPTAGGQYHWISEFAPPSKQKFLSYLSGWLSSLSWLIGITAAFFIAGNIIPALINLRNADVTPTAWQGYLWIMAMCLVVFAINGFFARYLPLLEGFLLCFMIMAYISLVVVLLVLSPKLTTTEVFQTFNPLDSRGILEMLSAQVFVFGTILGSDSTVHIAEETQHAAIVIPRAMVASYCIMGVADFALIITYCYCFVDPEAAFAALDTTGYPFLEVFTNSTGSTEGAVTLGSILVILIGISATNFMASTSRQLFAFARDKGLPFGRFIARVNSRNGSPINSLVVVVLFALLICLIGLGSATALNAIVSLQGMAIAATYEVSLLCMIWRRLYGKKLPPAPWSLGRYGLTMNILGSIFGFYLLAYSAMPPAYPVTAENMNWGPVIFGGVMIISMIYYLLYGRHNYEGPVAYVKQTD